MSFNIDLARGVAVMALLGIFLQPAYSQSRTRSVSGFVLDAESGESLIGAGIQTAHNGVTVSNSYGFFSLPLRQQPDTIVVNYLGYKDYVCVIGQGADSTITIMMEPEALLQEVVVTASRKTTVGAVHVSISDVKNTPVVLGEPDVLKTIQLMPGVQSGMEGTAGIYVRGGGADENLFLLDGVPMYNVSHLLGVFSAFTPESIKDVTVYKGAFPARYGGRVSSVVDIRTNEGNLYSHHGSVGAGILNTKLHFEGPVWRGKTTYSISARAFNTIYAAPFLAGSDVKYNYYFYDLNAKLVHHFSPEDVVMLTFYRGSDVFSYVSDEQLVNTGYDRYVSQEEMKMNWGNTLASLKWNHVFGGKLFSSSSVSWYGYNMLSDVTGWETRTNVRTIDESVFSSDISDVIFRSDLDYSLMPYHKVYAGISGTWHSFSPSINRTIKIVNGDNAENNLPVSQKEGLEIGTYVEDDIRLWNILRADLGLRYTLMTVNGEKYSCFQPRASIDIGSWNGFSFKTSYARLSQYVHLLSSTQMSLPTDLWVPITEKIPPILTDQYSLGLYWENAGWDASIEGYYKHSDNVLEYKNGASLFYGADGWDSLVETGEAVSKGLEFYLRQSTGKLNGWVSYTLSKTDRRFPGGVNNGEWFPYQYDRRHNFIINMNYRFNSHVDAAATWMFASGNKMSMPSRKGIVQDLSNTGIVFASDVFDSKNNYTLPASHKLNVCLNLTKPLRRGEQVWSFSVYNLYNALNPNIVTPLYVKDDDGQESVELRTITYLPFMPSVSYTYSF